MNEFEETPEHKARRIESRARDYARGIVCIAIAQKLTTDVARAYSLALKAARELAEIEEADRA